MGVIERSNVQVTGRPAGPALVFAHGFGCDQSMWRYVVPAFEDRYRCVCFDLVGYGGSDLAAFDPVRHGTLQGWADDVIDICRELDLGDVTFVGRSVSAMIGVRAALTAPGLFDRLVLIGPSPRYIDDGDYLGGFRATDIDDLVDALDSNYVGWSEAMAPVIMGNPDRPELGQELTESFCRTDPAVARTFARVTFLSDSRIDLPQVTVPALVVQSAEDAIAPRVVGEYVAAHLPLGELALIDAVGHCPNLSAPAETVAAIEAFLSAHR